MSALLIVVVLLFSPDKSGFEYQVYMHPFKSMADCGNSVKDVEAARGKESIIPFCIPLKNGNEMI